MENDMALRQKVQDFKLPEVVQADINSWICVANTLAITTALFAAVQISLNAIVEQLMFSGKSMPLRVLRWIMYASVLVNISGTASAISVVNMASSLSSEARSQFFKGRDMNSTLPRVLLRPESSFARLRHFGMPSVFLWLTRLMLISYFAGSICLFISFYVWVFITQSKAAAASLLPIGIPAFLLVCSLVYY
ncbi:hypothetical protein FRC20_006957 [Serendipita sp. 405]|nr:hypothetical protein FRC15_006844 [Serendipita sp. 397]KAG8769646.1 hypothetical protein FRC16_006619 [Serendipita sp. 398]KAG8836721.1 hypothetical protein FRC20_006957 [Serendipita sp. 405]